METETFLENPDPAPSGSAESLSLVEAKSLQVFFLLFGTGPSTFTHYVS